VLGHQLADLDVDETQTQRALGYHSHIHHWTTSSRDRSPPGISEGLAELPLYMLLTPLPMLALQLGVGLTPGSRLRATSTNWSGRNATRLSPT
jgi:hypothetical protein